VHKLDEEDHRISIQILLSIALIVIALGVLVLSGPWRELRETAGYAASPKADNR